MLFLIFKLLSVHSFSLSTMQALTAFCLLILTPVALAVPAHHDKQRVTNFVVMGDR